MIDADYNRDQKSILDFLIESSHIDARDDDGNSFLHLAAVQGNLGLASKCIEMGADCNQRNKDGRTPLHFAAENGDEDMVRLLLTQGSRKETRDYDGETPAFCAVRNGNTVAIKLLLTSEEATNRKGENLLHAAVTVNASEEVIEALIDSQANVTKRNDFGLTPLELSCKLSNLPAVSTLLQHSTPSIALLHLTSSPSILDLLLDSLPEGAIEARDAEGATPLLRAVERGNMELVKRLLVAGGDVDAVDVDGIGTVHAAVVRDDVEMVEVLVRGGADLGVVSWNGDGLLHAAAARGGRRVVEVLVRNGCKVKSVNRDGYKPSDIARQLGRKEMLGVLEGLERKEEVGKSRLRFRGVSESEDVLNNKITHLIASESSMMRSKSTSRLNCIGNEINLTKKETKIPVRRSKSTKIK